MQRLAKPAILMILLACGCVAQNSLRSPAVSSNFTLSADDKAFALALASYSAGMAEERESGPASAKSVDFFVKAARNDPSNYLLARRASVGLLYRRRPKEAASVLETASAHNPTNYPLLLDLAVVYDIAKDYDSQMGTFERAIALSPTNASTYMAMVRSQLAHGYMEDALDTLKRGAKNSNAGLMSDLAFFNAAALLKGGFPDKSIAWFEFVLEHSNANLGEIHLILGGIHEGQGELKKAIRHYQLATQTDKPMADAFVRLAVLKSAKDPRAGLQILDKGDAQIPMNELILAGISFIGETENCMPDAILLLRRIQKRTTNTPTASLYLNLGGAYERNGQIDKADTVFRTALEQYPKAHQILNYLAYMWAEKGKKLEEGEKLTMRALTLEPDNGAYLDTMAWIYYMQGKNKQALGVMQKALQFLPDDPTVLDHMGDILAKAGKVDDALLYWQKSYKIDPSNEALKSKLEAHSAQHAEEQ